MKRRDIHMHAVYVQGLNRIWADFMRRGQRRRVMASSRSPVDIVGAPHELIFLEEGHVRVYGMARQAPRLLLLMGPGCLVNTECLEGGQTSHGYVVRAMTPVTLLVRDVTAWYERRLACEYPELYVNVVQALAGINLLFLYRAHAVTFGPVPPVCAPAGHPRYEGLSRAAPEGHGRAGRHHARDGIAAAGPAGGFRLSGKGAGRERPAAGHPAHEGTELSGEDVDPLEGW